MGDITSKYLATDTIVAGDIAAGAVGISEIADGTLVGSEVAVVADDNVIGGIPVIHRIDTAGGATANTDVTLTYKTRILDVWTVNLAIGTTSDTITITDGSTDITDAIDISGADKTVARAGTIDNAVHEIAAAGTLRVTETDGGGSDSPAVSVYVLGVRVA